MDKSRTPITKPGNTLVVATSGGDYTTTATAIAAAVAAGATVSNPFVIIKMPLATVDHTTQPEGVFLFDYDALVQAGGYDNRYLWDAPERCRQRGWTLPYPALIALRYDDNANYADFWETPHATLAVNSVNLAPRDYAAWFGIPITAALIPSSLDGTGYLTTQELTRNVVRRGWELAVHCLNNAGHTANSADIVISDCKASIALIKAMVDDLPAVDIVLNFGVDGYIQPGNVSLSAMIESRAKANSKLGNYLRRTFKWACNSFPSQALGTAGNVSSPYFGDANNFTVSDGSGGTSTIAAYLQRAVSPGSRTMVLFHQNGGDYLDVAHFKTLIDTLVTLRDAGKLLPVTLNGLFNADTMPAMYDAESRIITARWNGIPYGNIENLPEMLTSTTHNPYTTHGMWASETSVGNTVAINADLGDVDLLDGGTKCIKIVSAEASVQAPRLNVRFPLVGGGRYIFRFAVKSVDVAAIKLYVDMSLMATGGTNNLYVPLPPLVETSYSGTGHPALPADNTWHWRYYPVAIPEDYNFVLIKITNHIAAAGGFTYYLDNFEWLRVG